MIALDFLFLAPARSFVLLGFPAAVWTLPKVHHVTATFFSSRLDDTLISFFFSSFSLMKRPRPIGPYTRREFATLAEKKKTREHANLIYPSEGRTTRGGGRGRTAHLMPGRGVYTREPKALVKILYFFGIAIPLLRPKDLEQKGGIGVDAEGDTGVKKEQNGGAAEGRGVDGRTEWNMTWERGATCVILALT